MDRYAAFTRFGGFNWRTEPHLLPEGIARDLNGVRITTQGLRKASPDANVSGTIPGACVALYDWNGNIVSDTAIRYAYFEHDGRLIRGHREMSATVKPPQYQTETTRALGYWDILGIAAPAVAPSAAAGAAGTPDGTYTAFVTFINAHGDESPPSPAVTVTVTADQIAYTAIPIGYGLGDLNSSTSITSVDNPGSLRVGMRITTPGGQIPAGTYITAISGTTVTISQAATATVANVELQDAQATGRRLYRAGGTVPGALLETELANVTATTYTSNAADTALGEPCATEGMSVLPSMGGVTLAANGRLFGIVQGSSAVATAGAEVHWSEKNAPHLYTADTNFVAMADPAVSTHYGLDRTFIFTTGELYQLIDTSELSKVGPAPCVLGARPYAVNYKDQVWFACLRGLCATDGASIQPLTENLLNDTSNAWIGEVCYGATVEGNRYHAMVKLAPPAWGGTVPATRYAVLTYDPSVEGGWLLATVEGPLTIEYLPSANVVAAAYNTIVYYFYGAGSSQYSAYYATRALVGSSYSQLKRVRRALFLSVADLNLTPPTIDLAIYVDDVASGTISTLSTGDTERRAEWLASGVRGRSFYALLTLGAYCTIAEIGIWFSETQRGAP